MQHTFYRNYGKRVLDVVAASVALLVLWPVLAVTGIAVRCALGRPVLFRQQRPGFGGRLFTLSKFRTMSGERDRAGNLLPDEERLSRFGRFLRASSLDELPELCSVVTGQMSLVGPRPLLPEYLDRYTSEQARRHDVRPGLTGWAQVNGRNAIGWDTKLAYDTWYVDHVSFLLDLKILLLTVLKVVRGDGVAAAGHATAPRFEGSVVKLADCCAKSSTGEIGPGVIVIGAGGHAKVVIGALRAAGRQVAAVFDDAPQQWGKCLLGVPVHGPLARLDAMPEREAVIAIGAGEVRRRLAERYRLRYTAVVHPHAWVDPTAHVAPGAMIMAGAVIQSQAVIAEHAIVNTGATVDHDCQVGSCAHLAPGVHLAGNVCVQPLAMLGVGAVVIPGRTIGAGTTVGAGATVIRDLPAGVVAAGCPARILQRRAAA